MSGAILAAAGVAAAAGTSYSVTVGTTGGVFGFSNATIGAMSPATFKGISIRAAYTSGVPQFFFSLSSLGLAQSLFNGILIQNTAGAWVRMSTATAVSFENTGLNFAGCSTWVFNLSAGWSATVPSPRTMLLYA